MNDFNIIYYNNVLLNKDKNIVNDNNRIFNIAQAFNKNLVTNETLNYVNASSLVKLRVINLIKSRANCNYLQFNQVEFLKAIISYRTILK